MPDSSQHVHRGLVDRQERTDYTRSTRYDNWSLETTRRHSPIFREYAVAVASRVGPRKKEPRNRPALALLCITGDETVCDHVECRVPVFLIRYHVCSFAIIIRSRLSRTIEARDSSVTLIIAIDVRSARRSLVSIRC